MTEKKARRAGNGAKRKRVILYCGADPSRRENSLFYLNLFWKLTMLGRERGIEMIPVMDGRPESQLEIIPDEVAALTSGGGIDGIVGIMLFEAMTGWMKESGLPFAVLLCGTAARHVDFDYRKMIDVSFARLAEQGCRSVGLMMPSHVTGADLLEYIDGRAEALGLELNYEWILVSLKSRELSGYTSFRSLWDLKDHPDGLVVFPDVTARGVVTAILEKNVRVPSELKLVLHRNEASPYAVPVPCDWVENSGSDLAEALLRQLEAQWEGKALRKRLVPFRLVRGATA